MPSSGWKKLNISEGRSQSYERLLAASSDSSSPLERVDDLFYIPKPTGQETVSAFTQDFERMKQITISQVNHSRNPLAFGHNETILQRPPSETGKNFLARVLKAIPKEGTVQSSLESAYTQGVFNVAHSVMQPTGNIAVSLTPISPTIKHKKGQLTELVCPVELRYRFDEDKPGDPHDPEQLSPTIGMLELHYAYDEKKKQLYLDKAQATAGLAYDLATKSKPKSIITQCSKWNKARNDAQGRYSSTKDSIGNNDEPIIKLVEAIETSNQSKLSSNFNSKQQFLSSAARICEYYAVAKGLLFEKYPQLKRAITALIAHMTSILEGDGENKEKILVKFLETFPPLLNFFSALETEAQSHKSPSQLSEIYAQQIPRFYGKLKSIMPEDETYTTRLNTVMVKSSEILTKSMEDKLQAKGLRLNPVLLSVKAGNADFFSKSSYTPNDVSEHFTQLDKNISEEAGTFKLGDFLKGLFTKLFTKTPPSSPTVSKSSLMGLFDRRLLTKHKKAFDLLRETHSSTSGDIPQKQPDTASVH